MTDWKAEHAALEIECRQQRRELERLRMEIVNRDAVAAELDKQLAAANALLSDIGSAVVASARQGVSRLPPPLEDRLNAHLAGQPAAQSATGLDHTFEDWAKAVWADEFARWEGK